MYLNIFDRISFWSLFLVVVLLPFFFLPFTNIPIETSKGFLLVVGLTLCIIFWAIARFLDGKIILPKSMCLLGGAGVVFAFFLSALLGGASEVSFFGTMFDIGTFWFIFSGFILMLMSSIIFRDPLSAKVVLFGAVLSSAVVLIFQSARLFIPEVLSLGVLVGKTDNILGTWNAFGFFAGMSGLMMLLVVEFFSTRGIKKWILEALIILSMALVAAVNFPFVWGLIGVSSLIIFVYKISIISNKSQSEGEKRHFPLFSFIVIMVALLFSISGAFIRGILPNRLGLSNSEISPSFGATMSVTKAVLKADPIFGTGPNKFEAAWAMYKPAVVNTTQFWDVSFNSGSGLLPTFASTTGSLGILTLFIFFTSLIVGGIKSIFSGIKNGLNWVTMTFFLLSLYLFISSFFYPVGAVIFLLAFAFAGVFLGLSAGSVQNGEISLSFLNDHRRSFFSILFFVLIIIVSVAASFKYLERLASVSYFRKALTVTTIPDAENLINKALKLYTNDLYLRTYAQVYLLKLDSLAKKDASLSDRERTDAQSSLDQAVNGAQAATAYNPKNYLNFQALGSVYQMAGSLGIKDGYSKAIEAYTIASTLNPNNPRLKLAMASISFALGKTKEAKDYGNAAITLKPDYVDALVVLSQIFKSEGDNEGAFFYAQTALSTAPTDENLIQYVDSLKTGKENTSTDQKKNTSILENNP